MSQGISRFLKPSARLKQQLLLWIERGVILVAWFNLLLVAFHETYVPLRSFYLRAALALRSAAVDTPALAYWVGPPGEVSLFYDPVVGIQPHRQTQSYLSAVERLVSVLERQGVDSPQVEPLLADLRQRSRELIDQNPFDISNQSGKLEQIKNRVRDHLGMESATQAFERFWSQAYLREKSWPRAIRFFDREMRFLLQSNYYRGIGETGLPADYFALIDTPFVIFFALDFLRRSWLIRRRYPALPWKTAVFSHWSDLLFLLPFWRWLRLLPVIIRSSQANFPNLEPLRAIVSRGLLAGLASELTEVVVIEVIDSIQRGVRSGLLSQHLLSATNVTYVQVNDINEVQALADLLIRIAATRVLPEVRPQLEALLVYQVNAIIKQAPAYGPLAALPGMAAIGGQIAAQVASSLSGVATGGPQAAYKALNAGRDREAEARFDRLVDQASQTFRRELQKPENLQEIQTLIDDLLEEIKLSYIRRSRDRSDSLQLLAEAQQLRAKAGK